MKKNINIKYAKTVFLWENVHLIAASPLPIVIFAVGMVYLVISGPSCSKLTTSLVNVSLKFQTLISHCRNS